MDPTAQIPGHLTTPPQRRQRRGQSASATRSSPFAFRILIGAPACIGARARECGVGRGHPAASQPWTLWSRRRATHIAAVLSPSLHLSQRKRHRSPQPKELCGSSSAAALTAGSKRDEM